MNNFFRQNSTKKFTKEKTEVCGTLNNTVLVKIRFMRPFQRLSQLVSTKTDTALHSEILYPRDQQNVKLCSRKLITDFNICISSCPVLSM